MPVSITEIASTTSSFSTEPSVGVDAGGGIVVVTRGLSPGEGGAGGKDGEVRGEAELGRRLKMLKSFILAERPLLTTGAVWL